MLRHTYKDSLHAIDACYVQDAYWNQHFTQTFKWWTTSPKTFQRDTGWSHFCASDHISKGKLSHHVEETHLGCLHLRSYSFGHCRQLIFKVKVELQSPVQRTTASELEVLIHILTASHSAANCPSGFWRSPPGVSGHMKTDQTLSTTTPVCHFRGIGPKLHATLRRHVSQDNPIMSSTLHFRVNLIYIWLLVT